MTQTTITIQNNRTDDEIYVLLTAKNMEKGKQPKHAIQLNKPTKLSKDTVVSFETITAARLYVSVGPVSPAPNLDDDHYFGWIEFTKTEKDGTLWINLTNVDITGLPLALTGSENGKPFSLGTLLPMKAPKKDPQEHSLIDALEKIFTKERPVKAKVHCKNGYIKVLSPIHAPESYASFAPYIKRLCEANAPVSITSDAPKGKSAVTFKGQFTDPAKNKNNNVMELKDGNGNTITIDDKNLTTKTLYQCAGGTYLYNGKPEPFNIPVNNNDPHAGLKKILNSVIRNILVGFNEGYFSENGPNDSEYFTGMKPFEYGGNQYAEVIHQYTNSYGFSYADGNLKTLIRADATKPVTLHVLQDTQTGYYEEYPVQPIAGLYQFGIGTGSDHLGSIKINGFTYEPSEQGAYGGFLPYLTEWTKMEFTGKSEHQNHYIWIKNGDVVEGECLTGHHIWVDGSKPPKSSDKAPKGYTNLTWGANLKWQSGAKPPPHP
ncbi:beta-1,3-glucanase family protein [Pseudovibrio exalbescens]|uniref:beta-1,3-glucanase family protein n=1 Tax=Pseudovibrio exalbescens TaxID=197461 RepID=UPI002367241F|nr:beta-1,3-glucanase family protein [Pseudovibrio exalbescens]MDD7910280.1 beta-1,3-glucanase family protein [Pseudovibrio exalbescens]